MQDTTTSVSIVNAIRLDVSSVLYVQQSIRTEVGIRVTRNTIHTLTSEARRSLYSVHNYFKVHATITINWGMSISHEKDVKMCIIIYDLSINEAIPSLLIFEIL